MARFDHILVPIDFSEISLAALDYAVELASKLGAHLTILHVIQMPPYDPQRPVANAVDREAQATISAEREIRSAARRRRGPGRSIIELLRKGLPWEEIQLVADEFDADLIVMGTHGRRGLLVGQRRTERGADESCPRADCPPGMMNVVLLTSTWPFSLGFTRGDRG